MLELPQDADRFMDLLDQPALLTLSGLVSALIFVTIFYGNARLYFGRQRWPEGLLVLLGLVGATLSLCALWSCLWLVPICAVFLLVGAAACLWQNRIKLACCHIGSGWRPWLALLLLLLQAIWAAAPFCRYDQWNYHLVVAKYILANQVLPAVIYDDHIFFTGIYEFLLLIPRWFLKHDVWLASFADCLTWLLTAIIIAAAMQRFWSQAYCRETEPQSHVPEHYDAPHYLVLLAFVMALSPYQHSLTNAKPEALLAAISLLILVAWPLATPSERDWRWLGWLLVWPLALKVTWLHAVGSFAVVLLLYCWRRKNLHALIMAAQGGLLALVLQLPIWLKNAKFFANPLHPLQLPLFHSSYWHTAMAEHWQASSGAARSFGAYWRILGWHLPQVVLRDFWPFLLLIALPSFTLMIRKHLFAKSRAVQLSACAAAEWPALRQRRSLVLVVITIFVLLTPLALDPKVQARFALPLLGMILYLVLVQLRALGWSARRCEGMLLLLTLLCGSWDVSLRKLGELVKSGSVRRYYADYGAPYDHLPIAEVINQHRRATYGPQPLDQHIVVSLDPTKFFFDSAHIRWGHYDYQMLRQDFLARTGGRGTGCQFLADYSMRYFVLKPSTSPPLEPWLQALLQQYGERLSVQYPIWHLAPEHLNEVQHDLNVCPMLETS